MKKGETRFFLRVPYGRTSLGEDSLCENSLENPRHSYFPAMGHPSCVRAHMDSAQPLTSFDRSRYTFGNIGVERTDDVRSMYLNVCAELFKVIKGIKNFGDASATNRYIRSAPNALTAISYANNTGNILTMTVKLDVNVN